ncbi:MAG: glycogen/starch/alpha-glucan phosphorylase [Lachnospirales bacterium]
MELYENITRDEFKKRLIENIKTLSMTTYNLASPEQVYGALAFTIRDIVVDKWIKTNKTYKENDSKVLYYLSMEFLMGRFLGNAIINLCMNEEVSSVLEEMGIDYNLVEDAELDPGLGNGGLGRLAACFLDSLSTLELPAFGCGIRYHYGIFKQKIEDGEQIELPDNWLQNGDAWGVQIKEDAVEVSFGGNVQTVARDEGEHTYKTVNAQQVLAIPYDYPVIGYNNNTVNTLRLWDAQAIHRFDLQSFNRGDYQKATEAENLARTLSEVLYPADEHISGKELRLKQQYFFISATIQTVIRKFSENHNDFKELPNKVAFQLNDTHPSIAVPELMRILLDEYSLSWKEAWEITKQTCAYTNHTIMSEALEKWPTELISRILPRVYMIIEEINRRFCKNLIDVYGNDPQKIRNMAIIADGQVRMAFLAIVGSHSVNGVAALHTEILKNQELRDFYEVYPNKFNNKTNGITQRRWLAHCNKGLSTLVSNSIGTDWVADLSKIKEIEKFKDDAAFRNEFAKIKHNNKIELSNLIMSTTGIAVDPNSIFDIQVKRLHEYKRQLMNILHILALYNRIRSNPHIDMAPQTFIFGAKSASAYHRAKLIIRLINAIADLVNNDPVVSKKIKVVFMENYRVSLAEKLIPAADLSEQISTASKEASGTGNMKFMLNGALTIGTMDGANVEIFEEVGKDNIFIFGMTADEVIELNKTNSYDPWDIFNINSDVRSALTQLINGTLLPNDTYIFREIYDALLNGFNGARADEYYILKDFESYSKACERANKYYKNQEAWIKSAIINVANSGKFSSDRTIQEYANEIWNLKPVKIVMD